MRNALRVARALIVAGAVVTAYGVTAVAPAAAATTTASWSSAVTNTGSNTDFDDGSVTFSGPMNNVSRLTISTSGYGHDHGTGVTLEVRLLPSATTVYSATLAGTSTQSMNIDVSFPAVNGVTGVQITSTPFQNQSFHNFSSSDTVTIHDSAGGTPPSCTLVGGIPVCTNVAVGAELLRATVQEVETVIVATHTVVGTVDIYRFTLPNGASVTLPCVVLTVNSTTVNPCRTANGTFVSRLANLVNNTVNQPSATLGDPLVTRGICESRVTVTVAGIGVENFPALAVC